eukprot:scaffold14404_cov78-Skeletonema_dohrnii-CCMP3373.AAC.1
MIATNMNVTTAMISSAQSALRTAAAINVTIVTKFSVQNVQMRQGCVVVVNVMSYVAMIVNFKNFDRGSGIAQNASN